jgi:hypothetical protein
MRKSSLHHARGIHSRVNVLPLRAFVGFSLLVAIIIGLISSPRSMAEPADSHAFSDVEVALEWIPDVNEEFAEGDLQELAQRLNITIAEARLRMQVENAAVTLQNYAAESWPDSFAGLWIDPSGEPVVSIAFTDTNPGRLNKIQDVFPFPELLRLASARSSYASLTDAHLQMVADRSILQDGGTHLRLPAAIAEARGKYDLDISIPDGTILVYLERAEPAWRTHLRDIMACP